jgi:hypothetical protein
MARGALLPPALRATMRILEGRRDKTYCRRARVRPQRHRQMQAAVQEHLLRFVPLAGHIRQMLEEREDYLPPRVRFESELEDQSSATDAEKALRIVIGWARRRGLRLRRRVRTFSCDNLTA